MKQTDRNKAELSNTRRQKPTNLTKQASPVQNLFRLLGPAKNIKAQIGEDNEVLDP